jgi:uncharacterized protein YjbJ (UPF0337 family)
MPRGRKKAANRVDEIREQAKEVAGQSGEALKGFAEETGSAAKEFAGKTKDAARELVDAIERAANRVETQKKSGRRGRKLVGTLTIIGIGVAVLANEKLREAIGGAVKRTQSPPWEPRVSDAGNGEVSQTVAGTTTEQA